MESWAILLYAIVFVAGANHVHAKVNPRPPNYVRRGPIVITPANLLSEKKWTPEGVTYNKRILFFTISAMIVFVVGYLLLDVMLNL